MSKDVKLQLKTDWQEWMRVCDWKIPDNYPKPSAVSSHRWAWEFLRRNDEFKKDFENLVSIKNDGQSYEPGRRPRDLARYAIQKKWHISSFAPGILGDIEGKYKAPCYFKSGVANYVHSRKIQGVAGIEDGYYYLEKEEPEEFFYRINLTLPIEPQIKAIKKHATVNKESRIKNNSSGYVKQKRLHVNKFPLYLRVYDAVQAGEKEPAIADFLSYEDNVLSEKDVNNAYEAADKFVQGEYIFIPLPK